MADIVNLRQFRKQKQRSDKTTKAQENRAKFGKTKSETERQSIEDRIAQHKLDGAKRDPKSD